MSSVQKPTGRTIRVTRLATVDVPEVGFTITDRVEAADYVARAIPSDYGEAYVVQKVSDPDDPTYHVNLCGSASSCECLGHLRWGHCRHVEGLTVLDMLGVLPRCEPTVSVQE